MRRIGLGFWVLLLVAGMYLASWHMDAPQAEELPGSPTPSVSDAELNLYITVYKAMQEDHSLEIEAALREHQMDLETFRSLERRIQANPRLVEKVREALLEFARSRSALAFSPATPTPSATPTSRAQKKAR